MILNSLQTQVHEKQSRFAQPLYSCINVGIILSNKSENYFILHIVYSPFKAHVSLSSM